MKLSREIVKTLIETSLTVEAADKLINEQYNFESIEEKIAFLKGMFDVEVIGHKGKDEAIYFVMLATIINN